MLLIGSAAAQKSVSSQEKGVSSALLLGNAKSLYGYYLQACKKYSGKYVYVTSAVLFVGLLTYLASNLFCGLLPIN